MNDLIEFLRARLVEEAKIAERSAIFRTSSGLAWLSPPSEETRLLVLSGERLAADCEARRQIVENHAQRYRASGELHDAQTLRLLSVLYSNHPDYRQEWKP